MAITFTTEQATTLLAKFDAAIAQDEPKGKITTWEKSADGKYYTHRSVDWAKRAWFKASTETGRLVFNIIKPQNANISSIVYGYYHGHLIETFLNHFDQHFASGVASALPTANDRCSS